MTTTTMMNRRSRTATSLSSRIRILLSTTAICNLWVFLTVLERSQMVVSLAAATTKGSDRQLNIAFVTGNAMKVREIEMILAEEGAIDLENPEESLGEFLV
jgi:hypothetical protein